MPVCTQCGTDKSSQEFHKLSSHPNGRRPECKVCRNGKNKEYYYRNRKRLLAWQRVFNQTEHRKSYARRYMAKQLRLRQDLAATRPRPTLCEVCGTSGDHRGIFFDHDHDSGRFRGWLCNRCNRVLGLCGEDITVLRQLAFYLEKAKCQ